MKDFNPSNKNENLKSKHFKENGKEQIIKVIEKILFIIFFLLLIYNVTFIINKAITSQNCITFFGISLIIQKDKTMENTLHENDLLIVKNTKNQDDLKINDIIIYKSGEYFSAHRIQNIRLESAKTFYITRGDSNLYNDIEEKQIEEVKGKLILSIPILGFFINIFESWIVTIVIILFCAFKYLYNKELRKRQNKRKKKKEGYYF